MAKFTFPAFWFFLLLVSLSVLVLRWREPELARPYRTPCAWLTSLTFFAGAAFMLRESYFWALSKLEPQAIWTLAALGAGIAACAVDQFLGPIAEE